MPRASKGRRIALTIRLPYDEYREVAARAKARNWSLSDYVGYCVVRELRPKSIGKHRERPAPNATLREFDDIEHTFADEVAARG